MSNKQFPSAKIKKLLENLYLVGVVDGLHLSEKGTKHSDLYKVASEAWKRKKIDDTFKAIRSCIEEG